MSTRKRWADFSTPQRVAIVVASAVEVTLTGIALADLARRSTSDVRGPKALWVLGCVVQPVGPIAYLVLGRRSTVSHP